MSLVNQVLRDLQGRQAELPNVNMQGQIRPVFVPKKKGFQLLLMMGLVLALVFGGYSFVPSLWHEQVFLEEDVTVPSAISPPVMQPTADISSSVLEGPIVNSLAAIRLSQAGDHERLVLEFSRVNHILPEVILNRRLLEIALPEIAQEIWPLPESVQNSSLVTQLSVSKQDQMWRFQARFKTDVRIETLRLDADGSYGERLVVDIYAQPAATETAIEKINVPEHERPAPITQATIKPPVVEKQQRVLSAREQAEAFYLSGVSAAKKQQMQDALQYWHQALGLDPGLLVARKNLIVGLLLNHRQQADALFLDGLSLHDPIALRKWYARALLPVAGASEAATILAEQKVASDMDEEYLALQAGLWQQAGNYPQAEELYLQLNRDFPEKSLYAFGLAVALDQQQKVDFAVSSYRSALEGGLADDLRDYALRRLSDLHSRGAK